MRGGGKRRRRMLRIEVADFADTAGIDSGWIAAFRSDLIQNLAPFRDWSIIDGRQVATKASGEPEQIDYLFEGTVIARGDEPMLSLRLSNRPDGRTLWADSVSLSSSQWNRSQLDVISNIAANLECYISSDRLAMVIDSARMDLTSHDTWLRGDRALMRWTPEGAEEARRIFNAILREDPDHAPSLFRLA